MRLVSRLLRHNAGSAVVEYALLGSLIAIAAIMAMDGMGREVNTSFNHVEQGMVNGNR